jgi:cytosine/adenosine deaminase-related metal-dependent hydrolase
MNELTSDSNSTATKTTPGLVCAHHHLYSALARGMPAPPSSPLNFNEILEQIWWRLDCALDLDMIYWSAKLGALEALESGTTCIIDHHESPNAIEGSLDLVAQACAEVGVRVSCAYGVTDRHQSIGRVAVTPQPHATLRAKKMTDGARRGLEENARYLRGGGRGYMGVHAAFTCASETLEAVAATALDLDVGVHIHVAEGPGDSDAGARLEHLAQDNWLLVHCVYLDRDLPGSIAHNPRSNMNNAVGYAAPANRPNRIVLGTDGIGADMLDEFRIGYVRHREHDVSAAPSTAWSWLTNSYDLFPEALVDEVTWSYFPVDPWSLAFTTGVRPDRVVVDGKVVVENGRATHLDRNEILRKAAEQAQRLFSKL